MIFVKHQDVRPVYSVWLSRDGEKCFGPGIAMLMEGIKRTGSLSSAAKDIGMAYSKAWRIMKRSEELTGCKLLISHAGGAHGGGASLTEEGERLLSDFTAFRKDIDDCIERAFQKYFGRI